MKGNKTTEGKEEDVLCKIVCVLVCVSYYPLQ